MICSTEDKFKKAIYNYMPEQLGASIWDSLNTYIKSANRWIKNTFLGNPLYNKYEELSEEVKDLLDTVVACKAFYEAIPSMDLTLESNGFGVVKSNLVAPASAHRVNSLRKQTQETMFNTMDDLLLLFLEEEELRGLFAKGEPFTKLTDSLFLVGSDLELYTGMEGATRKELYEHKAMIAEGELSIQKRISTVYFNELIQKVRAKELTREDLDILFKAKQLLGFYMKGQSEAFKSLGDHTVNLMEQQPESYPTYMGSTEYQNKNYPRYENKKEDSTYFFG